MRHEFIDAHRAGLAHAPEIVALQIDQHHVFRALLRMRGQLRHFGQVTVRIAAARPRASDGPRIDTPVTGDAHQPLRR